MVNEDFMLAKREKILAMKLMKEQIENDKLNFLD